MKTAHYPSEDTIYHMLVLANIPTLGPLLSKTVLAHCGSAEAALESSVKQLSKIPGIGTQTAKAIVHEQAPDYAKKEMELAEKHQCHILPFTHPNYPKRLKQCPDAPLLLYFKGQLDALNSERALGIVGTRKATAYGKKFLQTEMAAQSIQGLCIVSGLAYGIDTIAHQAAVDHQIPTIGVVGHGLHHVYPPQNRRLANNLCQQGGMLTEMGFQSAFTRHNFPMRNRIIAGMSDATLVVESAKKGGALITADLANGYHRDVFALQGRHSDTYSKGCNALIKQQKAQMVESFQDLAKAMLWDQKKRAIQRSLIPDLSEAAQGIVALLRAEGNITVDEMQMRLDYTPSELASILLELELEGVASALPGKMYQLI